MPCGLVNSPSVFQYFMHNVHSDILHRFVLIYIDNILVYSCDLQKHHHHVAEVHQMLTENQLLLMAEKHCFHQTSIQFLGNISRQGITMDKGLVASYSSKPLACMTMLLVVHYGSGREMFRPGRQRVCDLQECSPSTQGKTLTPPDAQPSMVIPWGGLYQGPTSIIW